MKNLINKIFTINDLKDRADDISLENYEEFKAALRIVGRYSPQIISNGRVNHYWIQDLIACLTGGEITPGGQGNSLPDLFWGEEQIEVKGLTNKEFSNNTPTRVSASKFFASNGGITAIKKLGENQKAIKKLVFDASYTDDYYMLTLTCGLDVEADYEDITIMFVSTPLLIENLISNVGDYNYKTPEGKEKSMKIKYPYTCVDLESLKKNLEVV
jgi:hypothetical protein